MTGMMILAFAVLMLSRSDNFCETAEIYQDNIGVPSDFKPVPFTVVYPPQGLTYNNQQYSTLPYFQGVQNPSTSYSNVNLQAVATQQGYMILAPVNPHAGLYSHSVPNQYNSKHAPSFLHSSIKLPTSLTGDNTGIFQSQTSYKNVYVPVATQPPVNQNINNIKKNPQVINAKPLLFNFPTPFQIPASSNLTNQTTNPTLQKFTIPPLFQHHVYHPLHYSSNQTSRIPPPPPRIYQNFNPIHVNPRPQPRAPVRPTTEKPPPQIPLRKPPPVQEVEEEEEEESEDKAEVNEEDNEEQQEEEEEEEEENNDKGNLEEEDDEDDRKNHENIQEEDHENNEEHDFLPPNSYSAKYRPHEHHEDDDEEKEAPPPRYRHKYYHHHHDDDDEEDEPPPRRPRKKYSSRHRHEDHDSDSTHIKENQKFVPLFFNDNFAPFTSTNFNDREPKIEFKMYKYVQASKPQMEVIEGKGTDLKPIIQRSQRSFQEKWFITTKTSSNQF